MAFPALSQAVKTEIGFQAYRDFTQNQNPAHFAVRYQYLSRYPEADVRAIMTKDINKLVKVANRAKADAWVDKALKLIHDPHFNEGAPVQTFGSFINEAETPHLPSDWAKGFEWPWMIGGGGSETPYLKNGKWKLYIWNAKTKKHYEYDFADDIFTLAEAADQVKTVNVGEFLARNPVLPTQWRWVKKMKPSEKLVVRYALAGGFKYPVTVRAVVDEASDWGKREVWVVVAMSDEYYGKGGQWTDDVENAQLYATKAAAQKVADKVGGVADRLIPTWQLNPDNLKEDRVTDWGKPGSCVVQVRGAKGYGVSKCGDPNVVGLMQPASGQAYPVCRFHAQVIGKKPGYKLITEAAGPTLDGYVKLGTSTVPSGQMIRIKCPQCDRVWSVSAIGFGATRCPSCKTKPSKADVYIADPNQLKESVTVSWLVMPEQGSGQTQSKEKKFDDKKAADTFAAELKKRDNVKAVSVKDTKGTLDEAYVVIDAEDPKEVWYLTPMASVQVKDKQKWTRDKKMAQKFTTFTDAEITARTQGGTVIPLTEDVTGPTRMQLQQMYDRLRAGKMSVQAALRHIEHMFSVSDVQLNSQGDIVYFVYKPVPFNSGANVRSYGDMYRG